MTNTSVNLRMVVLDILLELDKPGSLSHVVMGNALKKYQYLDKADRGFISRLALGVIERRLELDYIIDQFSSTKVNKLKSVIRNILRMGVYQLKYMTKVPASAACNEAVKLANKRGFASLKGFVNGVLRNISRGLDDIKYPDESTEYNRYLSVKYSMPEWIIDRWLDMLGSDRTVKALNALASDRVTFIRCNTVRITVEELKGKLEAEGAKVVRASEYLKRAMPDYALVLTEYDYLEGLESFNEGYFWVQDISSMLAAGAGIIKENDYIIDVCAAPGGKSLNAACLAVKGHVDARDISEYKTDIIEDNVYRLGINNVTAKVWDATVLDKEAVGRADVVIADLPCSGLGIMGRKPDIRYNMSSQSVLELAGLQRQILDTVSSYVKPGGYLLYSTCTVTKEENADNISWFTENYDYTLVEEPMQIVPGDLGGDGFYIARLKKN